MRRRRGNILQKAMAALLSVVLCVGLIVGAGPVDAWAAEEEGTQTIWLEVEVNTCDGMDPNPDPDIIGPVVLRTEGNVLIDKPISVSVENGVITYKVTGLQKNIKYHWLIRNDWIGLQVHPSSGNGPEYGMRTRLYSVRFKDGDEVLETRYLHSVRLMTPLNPPPVKDGYTFLGWVTENGGGISFPFDQYIREPMDIYASWAKDFTEITENAFEEMIRQIVNHMSVTNATTEEWVEDYIKKALDEYFKIDSTVDVTFSEFINATTYSEGTIKYRVGAVYNGFSCDESGEKSIPILPFEQERGWILDDAGKLTITSQEGMNDWVKTGREESGNLSKIKNIAIQDGVATIPDNAFAGCSDLSFVSIPETVTSIGNSAFAGDSSLSEITLPSKLQSINDGAFSNCSSLEKVVMQGTTPPASMGNSVFDGCKFVTDSANTEGIVIPPGSEDAYKKAGGVFEEYIREEKPEFTGETLNRKLQEILGMLAVSNDTTPGDVIDSVKRALDEYFHIDSLITIAGFELTGATIESEGFLKLTVTVKYGENSAQAEGTIPIAKLILPDRGWTLDEAGNLVISSQAGMDDWTLNGRAEGRFPAVKNVSIKSGVTGIPEDAFSGCGELKAVDIPDTVTSIGSQAFKHAYSLSEVTLPQNLQSIGDGAFSDCSSLEKVVMQGTTPPSIGASVFEQCKFVTDSSKGIVVPKGSEDTYKAAWGAMGDNILEKHTHNYDDTEWSNDENSHWKECSSCDVPGDKAAHEWGEGIVTKEPTEAEPGVMSYYCSVCGREKTQTIPATGGNGNQDGTGEGTPAVPDNNQGGDDSGNGPDSGNDTPGGSGDISVSGNDNPGGSESVSGNDNPGDGDIPVPGNDNPGGGDIPAPGNENPGGGDSPSVPENSNQSSRSGGDGSQQPEVSSSDLTLLWNTLTASAPKDAEPRTADGVPLELYATVAMIAGFFYLLLLFLDKYDITEEKRRESLARLVRWAKCGGWPRKLPVMVVLLLMRTYYRIVGDQRSKEKKI